MSIWIRFFYASMPICMIAQTLVLGYMAVVLNKMRRRKRHE